MQVLQYAGGNTVTGQRNFKLVARTHWAHAFRGSRQDHVTGAQRKVLAHVSNQRQDFVNHICRAAMLAHFAIHHQIQFSILRVALEFRDWNET